MQKTAPTARRLATIVVFVLSCVGLLVFLWISFGGPVPLKPKGYRFQAPFPEATQLAAQADVRISGVSVGKVRRLVRDPRGNATLATIEMSSRYAPVPVDTRAILRQKTLLGETFVELTPGSRRGPMLPEGGRLASRNVRATVGFDEILNTFDPKTRRAYQVWQRDGGRAIVHRGLDVNRALGELPAFLSAGDDLFSVLDSNRDAVRRLVRDTGFVFQAINRRQDRLRALIVNTDSVFSKTAQRSRQLTATFRALPAFLRESRRTFDRTQRFAVQTRPVIRLLRAPTRDLGPTVHDLRALAPDLDRTFLGVRRLVPVSARGLPALERVLRGFVPVFAQLGPFLSELNPMLQYLEQNQYTVGDFFTLGGPALADTLPSDTPGNVGHYLRQFGPQGIENAGIFKQRLPSNRGTAYPKGVELVSPNVARFLIGPSRDCANAGFEGRGTEAGRDGALASRPGCWAQEPSRFKGQSTIFPHVNREDYTKGDGTPGGAP